MPSGNSVATAKNFLKKVAKYVTLLFYSNSNPFVKFRFTYHTYFLVYPKKFESEFR